MRPLRVPWVQAAISSLVAGYLRLTFRSLRWRHADAERAAAVWEAGGPVILCFWHGRITMSPSCWPLDRAQPMRAMISKSSDGELIAKTVAKLGFPSVRGGAGEPGADKGGARAFRETLRWLKGGHGIAITPDGPRGPALSMTDGPVMLARSSGAAVLLCGLAARPCLRARSWDSHVVPLPFGRGAIAWDAPLTAPRDADPETLERLREEWRARLEAVTDRAEAMLA